MYFISSYYFLKKKFVCITIYLIYFEKILKSIRGKMIQKNSLIGHSYRFFGKKKQFSL